LFVDDGFIQYKEFRDYFGDDLLTSEANVVELTTLFNEIDTDHSGSVTPDKLLTFFNRHSTMISQQEAELFLGMVSDIGNESSISLKGTNQILENHLRIFLFRIFKSNA
jgi:Ca2+-binding EF-hand superfamily protein